MWKMDIHTRIIYDGTIAIEALSYVGRARAFGATRQIIFYKIISMKNEILHFQTKSCVLKIAQNRYIESCSEVWGSCYLPPSHQQHL